MSKHHLRGFSSYTRRYIRWRDKGKCQFEGCNADGEQVHHIHPRRKAFNRGMSLDQINSPDNGILLCEKCHKFLHKNANWRSYMKYFSKLIKSSKR